MAASFRSQVKTSSKIKNWFCSAAKRTPSTFSLTLPVHTLTTMKFIFPTFHQIHSPKHESFSSSSISQTIQASKIYEHITRNYQTRSTPSLLNDAPKKTSRSIEKRLSNINEILRRKETIQTHTHLLNTGNETTKYTGRQNNISGNQVTQRRRSRRKAERKPEPRRLRLMATFRLIFHYYTHLPDIDTQRFKRFIIFFLIIEKK